MSTTETDPIEVLDSSVTPEPIVLAETDEYNELVFVQKELTFFGKIDFFAVMAKGIERAMSEGVAIAEILDMPDREEGQPLDPDAFKEADTFVKAISQLAMNAPELLLDVYCVILAVPRGQRDDIKPRLEAQLSDEQGFQILHTFIDQNWEVLVSFFSERISPLIKKVGSKVQSSDLSKPSKRTRRTTQKASKS